jgi:hypothetical protein
MKGDGTIGAPVACHGCLKPRSASIAVFGGTPGSNAPVGVTIIGGVNGPVIVKLATEDEAPEKNIDPALNGSTSTKATEADTPLKVSEPIEPLVSTTAEEVEAPMKGSAPVPNKEKIAAEADEPLSPMLIEVAKLALETEVPSNVRTPVEADISNVALEADEPETPLPALMPTLAVEVLAPTIDMPLETGTTAVETDAPERAIPALKAKLAALAEAPKKLNSPGEDARLKEATEAEAAEAASTPIPPEIVSS